MKLIYYKNIHSLTIWKPCPTDCVHQNDSLYGTNREADAVKIFMGRIHCFMIRFSRFKQLEREKEGAEKKRKKNKGNLL